MSNCLILDNGNVVIMASDTALSFFGENEIVRVGNKQRKIFNIKDHLIFCSGKVSLVEEVISFIQNSDGFNVSVLSTHLKSKKIKKEEKIFSIEVVISTIIDEKIKTFQLSEYNNFEIEEITNEDDKSLKVHSAGIKTKECIALAEEELFKSREILYVIPKIYRRLSCPEIGGYLHVWSISKDGISEVSNNIPIDDKDNFHSLVADVIVGRILAGNTLTITNSGNNFTLDSTGATLTNAKFSIQTTNTKVIIDPTSGTSFRIQKNQGGTFVDKFWVNNTGDVNFAGNLTGATGTFSGTLSASVGNIGTLVIDANGLKTSDGNNYLRGNGDLKWGGLSITGSTATFAGTIFADKIVGQIVNSQITNGAVDDSKVTSGLNAGKVTQGTMSGYRISGGEIAIDTLSASSQVNIGGASLYTVGSNFEILANGTISLGSASGGTIGVGGSQITLDSNSIYVTGGYGGYGRSVAIYLSGYGKYMYFSNGILTGW